MAGTIATGCADLPARARPSAHRQLRNVTRVVGVDARAIPLARPLTTDLPARACAAARGRVGSVTREVGVNARAVAGRFTYREADLSGGARPSTCLAPGCRALPSAWVAAGYGATRRGRRGRGGRVALSVTENTAHEHGEEGERDAAS
jgi:hypothetical protein